MPPRSYANPEAFRQALEQRVRSTAGGTGMARFRQVLVFDRFLARIFQHFGERAIVKGGVVLELRLERARTTRVARVHIAATRASTRRSPSTERYARIAKEDGLAWPTIGELEEAVRGFLDPILAGEEGSWSPDDWAWKRR